MFKLNPYHQSFKRMFANQKCRIRKILGEKVRIEHFGNTAVTGLPGKGVIDILIGFENKTQIQVAIKKLVLNGYYLSRKGQRARRKRFFLSSNKKESGVNDTHLHLVLRESEDFRRSLLFRNKLRRNKLLREEYKKIKKAAAKAAKGNREIYTKLKSEFIETASLSK